MKTLTDFEVVELYLEKCRQFINPKIFAEINVRGLYHIINKLPKDKDEAHMVAVYRMVKHRKTLGINMDEFLIQEKLSRIKALQADIFNTPETEISNIKEKCNILLNFING